MREVVLEQINTKTVVVFHNYGLDLDVVQRTYERYKDEPPLVRGMPPVTRNIMWGRQLMRRIEEPMTAFQQINQLLGIKESKKIIATYNSLANALMLFEGMWLDAWVKSCEQAKAGLRATLLIRDDDGNLHVNFDPSLRTLICEAKALIQLARLPIPPSVKLVLGQESTFKLYSEQLSFAISEYNRIALLAPPALEELLRTMWEGLRELFEPALTTLTWMSLEVSEFVTKLLDALKKADDLLSRLNQTIENRISPGLEALRAAGFTSFEFDAESLPFEVASPHKSSQVCLHGVCRCRHLWRSRAS